MKLITILVIFNLIGCATERLIYIKAKPYQFQKTIELKPRIIRTHPDDTAIYQAYILKFRQQLKFHNQQIDDYKKSFKTEK